MLSCVGVNLLPAAQGALLYDRSAILYGQYWRLLTGHLVHFTPGHLFLNLLSIVLAGGLIERLRPRLLPLLLVCSGLLISLAMLWLLPAMATFGGLSGIASAEFAALAAIGLVNGRGWRWAGIALLIVLAAKVSIDSAGGSPLQALPGAFTFVPVPLAHAVGALVGLAVGLRATQTLSNSGGRHDLDSVP